MLNQLNVLNIFLGVFSFFYDPLPDVATRRRQRAHASYSTLCKLTPGFLTCIIQSDEICDTGLQLTVIFLIS